jgi:hypothetical protein
LTTPLSAGSKTLSPLLHLKVTSKGGFNFSYTLLKMRLKHGLQANPRLTEKIGVGDFYLWRSVIATLQLQR